MYEPYELTKEVILQHKTKENLRILINEETEYPFGPKLVSFFNSLGFNDSYGQGFPSRWISPELIILVKCVFLFVINRVGSFAYAK